MKPVTVDRAIVRAWFAPFVTGVAGIVVILMLGHVRKVTAAALGAAITWLDVGMIVLALVPPLLVFALPLAHLMAVVLTFGRMADDGELAALASAGASPWRLARSPFVCGVLVTGLGLAVAHWGQPWAWRQLQTTLSTVATRNVMATLADAPTVRTFGPLVLTAAEAQGPHAMTDLVVVSEPAAVLIAARGQLRAQPTPRGPRLALILEQGEFHPLLDDGPAYHRAQFTQAVLPLDIGAHVGARARLVNADGQLTTAALLEEAARPDVAAHRRLRLYKTATRRTASAALALVFSIAAVAIAMGSAVFRWPKAVMVIIAYYLMMRAGDGLVAQGFQAVDWVVWMPHGLITVVSGWGLWSVGRPQ